MQEEPEGKAQEKKVQEQAVCHSVGLIILPTF
jgi:hypothetical protein